MSISKGIDPERVELIILAQENSRLASHAATENLAIATFRSVKDYDFRFILDLAVLLKSHSPDILHTHGVLSDFYGTFASRLAGVPVIVVTAHSSPEVNLSFSNRKLRFLHMMEKFERIFVDQYIAVSKSNYDYLRKRLRIPESRMALVHNGISLESFEACSLETDSPEKCGISPGAMVVGFIGRLSSEKAPDLFVQAARFLLDSRENPEMQFLVVGDGPMKDELISLARKLGVDSRVLFMGFQENIPQILRLIDIVVIPSRMEGLPYLLLQAMAASRPIVAANVGGIPDVIEHGKNGLLVPPEDPKSIALSVADLLCNRSYSNKLGMHGRKTVENGFDISHMIEKTTAIYERLVPR